MYSGFKKIRKQIRAIIFHNFRRGQECIDELKLLSYSTLENRFIEFNCGQHSLKDEVREVLPKTAAVPENIDAVRELIMPSLMLFVSAKLG